MIVGIEHLKVLEEWAPKQEQIYRDACDVGVWARPRTIVRRDITNAVKGLVETYHSSRHEWGREPKGVTVTTFIPFEMDGDDYAGCFVRVSFCPTRRSAFISITLSHDCWSKAKRTIGVDSETPFKEFIR